MSRRFWGAAWSQDTGRDKTIFRKGWPGWKPGRFDV